MAEFIAHYPKVEVEFLLDDRRIDLVEESIDVAFRGGNIDGATLVARKLTDAVVGLFASPDFVAQHQMPDSVRGLAEMQCITPPSGSGHVVWQLRGPQGVADVTVSGRFRANTAQAQVQAARAGLGIALVPLSLAQPEVESGKLVRVLPNYDKNVGSFYAITPSRYLKVPAVTALVDFIATRLKNLYPDG